MSRHIDIRMLLVHQHLHVRTPAGIGTYPYAIGMIRLITDNVARVINLIPVRTDFDGDMQEIVTYPPNVELRVLYERALREPKLQVAWRHLAAIPRIAAAMREVDVVQIRLPSYPAFLASFLCLLTGKDMLVSIHGNFGQLLRAQVSAGKEAGPLAGQRSGAVADSRAGRFSGSRADSRARRLSRSLADRLSGPLADSRAGRFSGSRADSRARRFSGPLAGMLANAAADLADRYQRLLARRSLATLVTGEHTRELAGPEAIVIANHQITERDLLQRPDTCQGTQIRLLYVGRLSRAKGTDYLLDAVRLLVDGGMDAQLTLAGSGQDFDVAAAIAERDLRERVVMAGFVSWGPALFTLYRSADIFVFPSLSEGVPKAPMEALSQCLPVVATHAASGGYLVHEQHGLLVPPRDAAALAAAVRRLTGDGELRRACMARGFAVAQDSTRERMQERISHTLAAVFAARAARR